MATRRLKKELRDLSKSPLDGVTIVPSESDMFEWSITFDGPVDTPYQVSQ